jgi:hypothetical protein
LPGRGSGGGGADADWSSTLERETARPATPTSRNRRASLSLQSFAVESLGTVLGSF